jgi:antitoxin component of RelBE/YafQ-DinJ toxin-antitoxin module
MRPRGWSCGLPFHVRIPNDLTVRTCQATKATKHVKRFATRNELFADLGL